MSFPSSQLEALSDLYISTQGNKWTWSYCTNHWNFSQSAPNPCVERWCGIYCNENNSTIVQLVIINYNLNGTLPQSIGQLSDLININFQFNGGLRGTLPLSLSNLTKLELMQFPYNYLHGTLPEIFGNYSHLRKIDLSGNFFVGRIPSQFQQLPMIAEIILKQNSFQGTLSEWLSPQQIKNTISILDLTDNAFSGPLPSVANFTYIDGLYLNGNGFTGSIPDVFYGANRFRYLNIEDNFITGEFPYSLNQLPLFISIVMTSNLMSGRLVDSSVFWANLSLLNFFSVLENYFSGPFPNTFCDCEMQNGFSIGYNFFEGHLPVQCQTKLFLTVSLFSIQGNFFSGPLHQIFSSVEESRISQVSLGNNLFTGSISGTFFQKSPLLSVFGANTNCLSGTIPNEICELKYLLAIGLDGASTALNCRVQTVDLPFINLQAFTTKTSLYGTIPKCLFKYPGTVSLQLSGNSFTGDISDFDFPEGNVYRNISLSHNRLKGTIPENWLSQELRLLDLSYNSISGTLSSNVNFYPYSIVSLDVNRLSGTISQAFQQVDHLSMLKGNMFSCSLTDRSSIPKADADYDVYFCGSTTVDLSVYVWLTTSVSFSLLFLCLGSFWKKRRKVRKSPLQSRSLINYQLIGERERDEKENSRERHLIDHTFTELSKQALLSSSPSTIETQSSFFYHLLVEGRQYLSLAFVDNLPKELSRNHTCVNSFYSFTIRIRWFGAWISLYILCVLLPIYGVLGDYFRTYFYRYIWTISAIYLSGITATIIIGTFLMTFLLLAACLIFFIFPSSERVIHEKSSFASGLYAVRRRQLKKMIMILSSRSTYLWCCIWLINISVMIIADSIYVYLIINRSIKYEFFLQVILAFLKLAWNDVAIFRLVAGMKSRFLIKLETSTEQGESGNTFSRSTYSLLHPLREGENNEDPLSPNTHSSPWFSSKLLTQSDLLSITFMSIVNKVVIPCIAIFFISTSCFYNALVSESPQEAYLSLCYSVSDINDYTCFNLLGSREDDQSYTPAFSYSYQCSSAFLTDYVPVYVCMFLWSSVLLPALIFFADYNLTSNFRSKDLEDSSMLEKIRLSLCRALLPFQWKDWDHNPASYQMYIQSLILHRKQLLGLRISYTFSVMFVFGALFPPLALIAYFAIVNITLLEEYVTTTMIRAIGHNATPMVAGVNEEVEETSRDESEKESDDLSASTKTNTWIADYLEEECREIGEGGKEKLYTIMRFIFILSSFLYGFLLFDMTGDSSGWKNGMIPLILMICLSSVCFFCVQRYFQKKTVIEKLSSFRTNLDQSVVM